MENLEITEFDNLDFEVQEICSVDTYAGELEGEYSRTTRTLTTSMLN